METTDSRFLSDVTDDDITKIFNEYNLGPSVVPTPPQVQTNGSLSPVIMTGPSPYLTIHHDHVYRHQKELAEATHGRYLEGVLQLPTLIHGRDSFVIQLYAIPSSESKQVLQPNLLHTTVMNRATRKTKWKTTLSKAHWKVLLKVKGKKVFFLDPNTGFEYQDDLGCVTEDNKLILGGSGLLITLITPLQNQKRGNADSVRVYDVVSDIIAKRGKELGLDESDVGGTTEQFTNRKRNPLAKIELHRCRIQCDFLDEFSGGCAKICESVQSSEIRNVKQRDIGALELHDMSDPRASCSRGGFKVLLSLMFKASTMKTADGGRGGGGGGKAEDSQQPIKAVFVVVDKDDNVRHAEELYSGFNQISSMTVHDNTIAFIVPAQSPQVIKAIGRNRDVLRVALFRSHDSRFSMRRVPFVYVPHGDDSCPFCFVRRQTLPDGADFVTGELRKESRACKNQKRRKTESPACTSPQTPNATVQVAPSPPPPPPPAAHSPSSESGISCMSSPTWSIEDGSGRRISSESGSSSADESRSAALNPSPYNVYLAAGSCSPTSTNSCYGGGDSNQDEDMGSPSKLPRTEMTYTTLTPAGVVSTTSFEMGSPVPAAVHSPIETQPTISNGCYTYDSLMQDDFPDLFVMHDGGDKCDRAPVAEAVPDKDEDSAAFELVSFTGS